jgi:hypothetical protein
MRPRNLISAMAVVAVAIAYFQIHAYTAPPPDVPELPAGTVLIGDVPHILQKPDFCGEACAAMYLRKLGEPHTQDDVFNVAALDPAKGIGCVTRNLKWALERIGFRPGSTWFSVPAEPKAVLAEWGRLRADLGRGVPSIICTRYDESPETTEHFRLILGYDAKTDEVVYHEPAEKNGAYRRMTRKRFLSLWPLKYESDEWLLIRMRLEVKKIVAPEPKPAGVRYSDADFAQHVMKVKEKLPGEGFTICVQNPFVVIGDEPADTVRRRARGTVKWAATLLKDAFFESDPLEILEVWLFKDARSYRRNAEKLFGEVPDTPFGYYSSHHGALVMNISTGGGTLVHEIVHPFVEANFPDCPPWFNEGLGSLYEQCAERDGKIVGRTNWRLAGVKKAIGAGTLPSFKDLMAMDSSAFYGGSRGDNYGQSRYLCYYLQEQGLLRKYYRAYFAARKKDPTGYETLKTTLKAEDMAKFQTTWQEWVLTLRFP